MKLSQQKIVPAVDAPGTPLMRGLPTNLPAAFLQAPDSARLKFPSFVVAHKHKHFIWQPSSERDQTQRREEIVRRRQPKSECIGRFAECDFHALDPTPQRRWKIGRNGKKWRVARTERRRFQRR